MSFEASANDGTAAVVRRRLDPAGPRGDHVAALPLSLGHLEDHPAAIDPRLQGRVPWADHRTIAYLGQHEPAPLDPVGRLAADQVDARHTRRAGNPAQPR